ncbi:MAG TPA: glycosyltransferase family 4 protein [Candidatus Tectomicrobia bacterium]|nr:glycosyltransferase family 4 protein [Candidatus Tectomicrobia bacterium]
MNVLLLSSVFPNPRQPALGVFVRERALRVAQRVNLQVVAPVPWFPANRLVRGERGGAVPRVRDDGPLRVHHPRFFCIPRYLKWTDGACYAASLLRFLRALRRDFPFDLIDAHFAYPDGLAAVLLGKALGRPVVITLRGSIVRLSRYPMHRPQLRWALREGDRIVAVSESLREVAAGLGIARERITVIPNGVDAARFRPADRLAARAAVGLAEGRPVVLTVGGIYEDKGQHVLLQALPAVLRRVPDVLVVMVGEFRRDGYERRLRALIDELRLADHVRFAGGRPHDELPVWYAAADVFCLPTRSEGWANVLLEALACGVPVVTTRVGGNPEIVRDESLGVLVQPDDPAALGDALVRALTSPWDRAALVDHAAGHTWESAADRVVHEFRAATSTATGPVRAAPATGGTL